MVTSPCKGSTLRYFEPLQSYIIGTVAIYIILHSYELTVPPDWPLTADVRFKTENLPAVGLRAVIPHHAAGILTLPPIYRSLGMKHVW